MQLTTTDGKIVIKNPIDNEFFELESLDYYVVHPETDIVLYRCGRSWKIIYANITLYNGSSIIPSFNTIASDISTFSGTTSPVLTSGEYNAIPPSLADGDHSVLQVDNTGRLKVAADLQVADINIGAVELKDASTDTRAKISAANTSRAATDNVLLVQAIDAAGNPVSYAVITETPTMVSYAASTTIASGAKSVTVLTDSSFAGTVLGCTASPDSVYTFAASKGNTLSAIAITRSAGNFIIIKIV